MKFYPLFIWNSNTTFIAKGNQTEVVETFEAEEENTIELQQLGWQAILNNFKKYVESSNS